MTTSSPCPSRSPSPSPSPPPSSDGEDPPQTTSTPPHQTLDLILHTLLPLLLVISPPEEPRAFPGKWAHLRSKLSLLQSALLDASRCPEWASHPLFPDLLPSIRHTLLSLRSLSDRCRDPSLPGGKLLLQSDLDIASSSLSLHLHDLNLLLRSGLLSPYNPNTHTSTAIVLPHPGPSSSRDDLSLFVRDLFARLLIGSLDLKKKALDSLLRLLSPDDDPSKAASVVAQEGDVGCLVHLLDPCNHSLIREQAAAAVYSLAAASDASRRAVFEEGALGPLLRLLESGSAPAREKAAAAVEAITSDPGNAWAVPAYGGVPVLVEACRPGSGGLPATQAKASGALRNVAAAVGDARDTMAEEGAISVLVGMLDRGNCAAEEARRNATHCLWILASSGEELRARILQEGVLPRLVSMFREAPGTDPELPEHVVRTLHALSASQGFAKALSASQVFFAQLNELIIHGNAVMQQISASLLCNLSPGEEAKRAMAGSMPALIKMMELPKPVGVQEIAAMALVLLLSVRLNRKDLTRDEKSMTRLVQLLDPDSGEGLNKRFPVSVVLALASGSGGGGGGGCRKRIVASGTCQQLQKLAEIDVPGAKKALQRITRGRLKNLLSSISWRE